MELRRRADPTTIDNEREALRAQNSALEDLKRELANRVSAVQERERELQHALGAVNGGRSVAGPLPSWSVTPEEDDTDENALEALGRERALSEREHDLAAREARLVERENTLEVRSDDTVTLPAPPPDAVRLAQIESRLTELREAEKLFLRTREELANRSEAVSARERLVAQRERELDDREDGKGAWAGLELTEMEARLRRLEQKQPGEQTLGFSGGLRKLEKGTRPSSRD